MWVYFWDNNKAVSNEEILLTVIDENIFIISLLRFSYALHKWLKKIKEKNSMFESIDVERERERDRITIFMYSLSKDYMS